MAYPRGKHSWTTVLDGKLSETWLYSLRCWYKFERHPGHSVAIEKKKEKKEKKRS
jgi:hypothetical protein